MQPAPDKANKDDSESLFDFLEGDQNKPADQSVDNTVSDNNSERPRRVATGGDSSAEKPFPVIRKPVSVSRTGPLKAPRPGDPVEPPPGLTDGIRKSDAAETPRRVVPRADTDLSELDDLDDIGLGDVDLDFGQDEWPSSDSWTDKSYRPVPVNYQPAPASLARKAGYFLAFTLIACGAAYALIGVPSVQQWTQSAFAKVKETIDGFSGDASPGGTLSTDPTMTDSTLAPAPVDAALVVDSAPVSAETPAPKTLNELFREQLSQLEVLLQNGSLDAAEQAIQDMDRSVYGYGAPEFTEIEERIAALRQGDTSQPELTPPPQNTLAEDQLTEQQRIQQEAGQIEQEELARAERQAAEAAQAEAEAAQAEAAKAEAAKAEAAKADAAQAEAAQAEAARAEAARAEAARAEAARAEIAQQQREAELAAEQQRAAAEAARLESVRAEEQRIAQEAERARLQQAELDRAAAEAAQIRADRVAQEQARQEQLALALQQRAQLEQQRASDQASTDDANRPNDWQVVTPGTNDQTVQQLAASQREAARQQRLVEARQREEQTAGSQPPSAVVEPIQQDSTATAPETVVALAEPVPEPIVESSGPAPITDADLQQVYSQFTQLQNAIESRDINTVIALTQRSGARIQQVMQMFENNVAITARLRNVSTLDAAGEIQGTLQITRLERADGAVTGPPQNFSSVRLSSVRDGDGWSAISW